MSGIVRIGLRLIGKTRYVPNNNTTKYLQSMCHVRNGSSHVTKNSITSAQKRLAGYWNIISTVTKNILWYSTIPLTVIVVGCTFVIIKTPTFWEDLDMVDEVEEETLKYSIIPSKIITSSVLFNDGVINIKTRDDEKTFTNENTRNLIISEELDANIQEPFFKGKPIAITVGKFNGFLDKGKLKLNTEDGNTTFTFHHTVGLEVKKLTETLLNEIAANEKEQPEIIPQREGKFSYFFPGSKMTMKTPGSLKKWTGFSCTPSDSNFKKIFPIIGSFSSSGDTRVKIQKDNSDEVYYFTQIVNIECDKKLDENLQNQIAIKKVSSRNDLAKEMKTCELVIDSGAVVFKTQDGDKFVVRHRLICEIFEVGEQTYLSWTQKLKAFNSR
ncbi:hypothetical protein HCN44_008566 [Aphidius gifuensis]|uniref:Uncharacterized protein n=1 Tax=Aphidius gifuensis TaxID=684658 RepID=A0A834XN79_APHGI|nr:uncharacterized protein LOC122858296 [Aphidius gifuensis]KAF7989892.1 hypothetical protein HCN44_008566 [Aphidius gifuensis]